MRTRILTIFALVFLMVAAMSAERVSADDVAPPPGFVPGQESDAPAGTIAPRFQPYEDAPAGQGAGPNPNFVHPGASDSFMPYQAPPGPVLFGPDVTAFPRFWLRAEALYWRTKDSPLSAPLVTSGGSVLIGNQDVDLSGRGGGRFTFGFSLDADQVWALDASYFFLASSSVSRSVSSDGGPGSAQLDFPFINANTLLPDSSPISNPGFWAGNADLTVQSFLQGADFNLLTNVYNDSGLRFDLLGGVRWVNLQESLTFTTDSPDLPPVGPDLFHTFDRFTTNNNFYGGQFGVRARCDTPRLFMNALGKLSLGGTVETVRANGGTFTNAGGGFSSASGGYLTQASNIGSQTRGQFAVVPEVNLNFGVRMTPWASFVVGYSFLYISSVARPGDQIDRVINPHQSPAIGSNFSGIASSPAHPALNVRDTDFWAQGLNFSLDLRY